MFRVIGERPTRWVRQTDFSNDEAVGYLADRLARAGVEDELLKAGAVAGSTVLIGAADNAVTIVDSTGVVGEAAGDACGTGGGAGGAGSAVSAAAACGGWTGVAGIDAAGAGARGAWPAGWEGGEV